VNLHALHSFRSIRASLIPVGCALFACAFAVSASDQGAQRVASGLPQDWSNRHLIYSNPETHDEAIRNGTLAKWHKNADDPRYVVALEKKEQAAAAANGNASGGRAASDSASAAGGNAAADSPWEAGSQPRQRSPAATGPQIHRDWSNLMGGGLTTAATGSGATRTYPAKFSFDLSAKNCSTDFVVFTTSAAGASGAGTLASRAATFPATGTPSGTVNVTNSAYTPSQVLTLTASASSNTGLNFQVVSNASGGNTTNATNLAAAINRNGGAVGVTASSSTATVTVRAVTAVGTGTNIAMGGTLTNIGAWSSTAGTQGPGQPTIFALNQLYADTQANGGCQTTPQAVPAVFWSYNTGTGAVADLAPALSFYDDGAQVAFMQRSNTNVSSLVLLKWSSTSSVGTLGAPTAPTSATPATYRSCTAPCMVALALNGSPNDTNSAPFVDYVNDIIYVGDDTGKLHKFTNVFKSGTPAEVVGGGWPAQVAATTSILSSPVYDPTSGLIFVGSNGPAAATGNKLHSVAASGTVVSSGNIGSASTVNGVRDAPLVDATAQRVYAFIGADNSTNGSTDSLGNTCTTAPCAAVFQFATNSSLASQGTGTKVVVGLSVAGTDTSGAIQSGMFDDAYYSSANPASPSGSLYVCGSQPGAARTLTLWRIAIANNSFSASTRGPQLTGALTSADPCSPVTVFKNGSTEYLYASVANNGNAAGGGGCTSPANGCIYAYPLPLAASFNTTTPNNQTPTGTNRYMSVSTSAALNTTESAVATTLTAAQTGTYLGMTITQGANTLSGPVAYTLRKNGADTAISCSIINGASTCSDTTNTVSYAAGDTIDVRVQRTAGFFSFFSTIQVQLDAAIAAALNASGGTGGIIVDNTLTGGGSQVYFATRATPGIAVQATQAGLN